LAFGILCVLSLALGVLCVGAVSPRRGVLAPYRRIPDSSPGPKNGGGSTPGEAAPPRVLALYSHSIVLGGLLEISYTTRLTPRTSFVSRLETQASSSSGSLAQSAVMKSSVSTARTATT
jgi:hypothetical protein